MNQPSAHYSRWTWGAVLAALWLPLLWRIHHAWNASSELAHGWAVPFFAAWLLWQRLQNPPTSIALPPSAPPATGKPHCPPFDCWQTAAWCLLPLAVISLGFSLPILHANPLWPTAQWFGSISAIIATLALVQLAAGRAWMLHLAFPVLFMLTALDWPAAARQPLLAGLSVFNAQLAAEVTSLAGYPAVAEGSIIAVSGGYVGVDEACAGLRSLQAVWMFSWFFGELHRLRMAPRIGLVLVALLAAFIGNLARTLFLTWQIAAHGAGAGDRWHDSAGLIVLVVTLVVLVIFSQLMASREARRAQAGTEAKATPPPPLPLRPLASLPALLALFVAGFVLMAEAGTQIWFALRSKEAGGTQWRLRTDAPQWTRQKIPARVHELLRFTGGEYLLREGLPRGGAAVAYALRWEGDVMLGEMTDLHNPTICMPAIGARLESGPEQVRATAPGSGRELVFDAWRFSAAGTTQHVFFCVWDAFHGVTRPHQSEKGATPSLSLPRFRVERVLEGRRSADLAQVIFVLQGDATDDEARAWLQTAVDELLREKH